MVGVGMVVLVLVLVRRLGRLGMRGRTRTLYPNQNSPIYDNILTDADTPAIHITVYFILDNLTI